MRFVTRRAALFEGGLVQVCLLELVSLLTVAGEASRNRVRLQEPRCPSGMRIMAGNAFALCARMLHLGLLDLLCLFAVTSYAEGLGVALRQHDFAVFCGRVTGIATLALEGRMRELLHQLGLRRLVRVVALHAIGGGERLPLMRLDQARVLGIMAIEAQRRRRLGQVIVELDLALLADLMGDVASVATHIQRGVPAAFVGNVESLRMAGQAEVFVGPAGSRYQQLVLVVAGVRIVTLEAITNGWRMNGALQVGSVFVGVAGEAERVWRRSDELDASDVFGHPHFVATRATDRNGGMDCLAFGFVLMT